MRRTSFAVLFSILFIFFSLIPLGWSETPESNEIQLSGDEVEIIDYQPPPPWGTVARLKQWGRSFPYRVFQFFSNTGGRLIVKTKHDPFFAVQFIESVRITMLSLGFSEDEANQYAKASAKRIQFLVETLRPTQPTLAATQKKLKRLGQVYAALLYSYQWRLKNPHLPWDDNSAPIEALDIEAVGVDYIHFENAFGKSRDISKFRPDSLYEHLVALALVQERAVAETHVMQEMKVRSRFGESKTYESNVAFFDLTLLNQMNVAKERNQQRNPGIPEVSAAYREFYDQYLDRLDSPEAMKRSAELDEMGARTLKKGASKAKLNKRLKKMTAVTLSLGVLTVGLYSGFFQPDYLARLVTWIVPGMVGVAGTGAVFKALVTLIKRWTPGARAFNQTQSHEQKVFDGFFNEVEVFLKKNENKVSFAKLPLEGMVEEGKKQGRWKDDSERKMESHPLFYQCSKIYAAIARGN